MPQLPESFKTTLQGSGFYAGVHWSPSLPNPFGLSQTNNGARRAQSHQLQGRADQQFELGRPVRPPAPPFCRQDSTKELGNWMPLPLPPHLLQQRYERACKADANSAALKLGINVSSWPVATSEKGSETGTPEESTSSLSDTVAPPNSQQQPEPPAAVPFIDFLGVGAA